MSADITRVLEGVDLVNVEVCIPSLERKLPWSEIPLSGSAPPPKVTRAGSKKINHPDLLDRFHAIKKRANTLLAETGVRLLQGWAIPRDRSKDVLKNLIQMKAEFLHYRDTRFSADWDPKFEQWVCEHPEFEDQLRAGRLPLAEVKRSVGFTVAVYQVAPAEEAGDLADSVGGLGQRLIEDISNEASDIFQKLLRPKLTERRIRGTIRIRLGKMKDKLKGLSFLDGALIPMITAIEDVLRAIPEKGLVEGPVFDKVLSLVLMLEDPHKVRIGPQSGTADEPDEDDQLPSIPSETSSAAVKTSNTLEDDFDLFADLGLPPSIQKVTVAPAVVTFGAAPALQATVAPAPLVQKVTPVPVPQATAAPTVGAFKIYRF